MSTEKKVFVIERAPDVMNTVKHYLREDDISYAPFQSVAEALASPDFATLIIFFGSDSVAEIRQDIAQIKNSHSFVRVPKILILPFNSVVGQDEGKGLDAQETFCIPVEKLRFQAAISRFLMQAPRRVFRILVTILQSGSSIRYSGISMDFSDSGMAFECTSDFPVGEILQVSFVNPKNRTRLSLNAEVVRRTPTPAGSSVFYGVVFKRMSDKDMKNLSNFISGGA